MGWIGTLHPSVAKAMDVKSTTIVFELEAEAISSAKVPDFKVLSKFPAIRRDIALIVDDEINSSVIINSIRETVKNTLMSKNDHKSVLSEQSSIAVELFDVYIGEGIDEGKKSLAISLTLQEQSRTLKDDEIETLIQVVLNDLGEQHGAKLRD